MRAFRKVIFWTHLIAALIAGVVIFIMSVTGALLSFERNIIEFSERDQRYVAANGRDRLSPQAMLDRLKEQKPDAEPTSMSVTSEQDAAWLFSLGRAGRIYADPYTGALIGTGNSSVRSVMSELRSWHRWLALSGDNRAVGKAITGACNLLFVFLCISGIYIWFPRNLTWKAIKPVLWFRRGLHGKARNFNWHNVIGFWSSVLLIIFTVTATVISYRWAGDLLYTITGNEVPQRNGSAPKKPEKDYEFPSQIDAAWKTAESRSPEWRSIAMRLPVEDDLAVFTIDEGIYWNIFGRSTLTVNSVKADAVKWEPYGEQNGARKLRSWFRFTHTGETGGIIGQILGFIACVGGAVLVWTGFSLAFRRFGKWYRSRPNAAP